jgi:hypothetical protein
VHLMIAAEAIRQLDRIPSMAEPPREIVHDESNPHGRTPAFRVIDTAARAILVTRRTCNDMWHGRVQSRLAPRGLQPTRDALGEVSTCG